MVEIEGWTSPRSHSWREAELGFPPTVFHTPTSYVCTPTVIH